MWELEPQLRGNKNLIEEIVEDMLSPDTQIGLVEEDRAPTNDHESALAPFD